MSIKNTISFNAEPYHHIWVHCEGTELHVEIQKKDIKITENNEELDICITGDVAETFLKLWHELYENKTGI